MAQPGRRSLVSVFMALALGGCIEPSAVTCSNGLVCPVGTVCVESIPACVLPVQIESCRGKEDGSDCIANGDEGLCKAGACLPKGCGDGVKRDSEQCDLVDLGQTAEGDPIDDCTDLGYHDAGPIGCTPQCTFDVSACQRRCGDGIRDPEEQCDGADLMFDNCTDLGYYDDKPLACSGVCVPDTAVCTGYCGDGTRNGPEICDGAPPAGAGACFDYGYDAGSLGCAGFCGVDFAGCERIGWTSVAGSEAFIAVYDLDGRPDDLWAVGVNGLAAHFDGTQFSVTPTNTTQLLQAVWSTSSVAYAVGPAGTILRHANGAWAPMTSGTSANFNDVWGAAADDVYAVGGNAIYHYNGSAWSPMALAGLTDVGFSGVWGSGPTDVYAVGFDRVEAGVILHSTGGAFTVLRKGLPFAPSKIDGKSTSDVWVIGASTILHYNGTSWSELGSQTAVTTVAALGNGRAIVGSYNKSMVQYTDGIQLIPIPTTIQARAAWASGPEDVFLGGTAPVRRLRGAAWSPVYTVAPYDNTFTLAPFFSAVDGTAPNDIFAVGVAGLILHYDGARWTTVPSGTSNTLYSIFTLSASNSYAVGAGGAIVHFDGSQWSQVASGTIETLFDVWASSPTDIFVVGMNGVILHGDGSGFSRMTVAGHTRSLRAVWGAASNDVYAVGDGNLVMHYDGTSWTQLRADPTPYSNPLVDVLGTGPNNIYITASGFYLHYDGTSTFTQTAAPSGTSLGALAVVWTGEVYAAGNMSSSPVIIPFGSTTGERSAPFAFRGFKLFGTEVVGVGGDLGIVHADEEFISDTWFTPTQSAVSLPALGSVQAFGPRDVWATTPRGSFALVLHFDGTLWSAVRVPYVAEVSAVHVAGNDVFITAYDAYGAGALILHDAGTGSGFASELCTGAGTKHLRDIGGAGSSVVAVGDLGLICERSGSSFTATTSPVAVNLEAVWAANATEMVAVGANGAIVQRTSAGWVTATSPVTVQLNDVWGTSTSDVFAVGNNGVIVHWNGTTWTQQSSGTGSDLLGVTGTSATDVFAVGRYGAVIRYDGTRWAPVRTTSPDTFEAVAIAGQRAFFVGTSQSTGQGSLQTLARIKPW